MNEDLYYPLYDDLNEQTIELVGCKRVIDFAEIKYAAKESRFAHIIIEKENGVQHLMQYRILDDQSGYNSQTMVVPIKIQINRDLPRE